MWLVFGVHETKIHRRMHQLVVCACCTVRRCSVHFCYGHSDKSCSCGLHSTTHYGYNTKHTRALITDTRRTSQDKTIFGFADDRVDPRGRRVPENRLRHATKRFTLLGIETLISPQRTGESLLIVGLQLLWDQETSPPMLNVAL